MTRGLGEGKWVEGIDGEGKVWIGGGGVDGEGKVWIRGGGVEWEVKV